MFSKNHQITLNFSSFVLYLLTSYYIIIKRIIVANADYSTLIMIVVPSSVWILINSPIAPLLAISIIFSISILWWFKLSFILLFAFNEIRVLARFEIRALFSAFPSPEYRIPSFVFPESRIPSPEFRFQWPLCLLCDSVVKNRRWLNVLS